MKLIKKAQGWLIEPVTSDQSEVLDQIMAGFNRLIYKRFAKAETEAIHLLPLVHNCPMERKA